MLDRDGNGFISKQELGMAMRSLGYMPSEVELAIIMQRLDMDGETHTRTLTHTLGCIRGQCTLTSKHTRAPTHRQTLRRFLKASVSLSMYCLRLYYLLMVFRARVF